MLQIGTRSLDAWQDVSPPMRDESLLSRLHELARSILAHPPLPLLLLAMVATPLNMSVDLGLGVLAIASAIALWQAQRHAPLDSHAIVGRDLGYATAAGILAAVWIAIQVLPFGSLGLAHPMSQSVEEALGKTSWQSISIDKSATLEALVWLGVIGAFGLSVLLTAIERHSAYLLSVALAATCTLWSAATLASPYVAGAERLISADAARFPGLVGSLLILSDMTRRFGQNDGVRLMRNRTGPNKRRKLFAHLLAMPICMAATLLPGGGLVSLGMGGSIVCALALLRFSEGRNQHIGRFLALIMVLATTAILALRTPAQPDLTMITRSHSDPLVNALVATAPAAGLGAGALPTANELYLASQTTWVASTFTRLALEIGAVPAAILLLAAIAAALKQADASVRRKRDWHFAAAGSATLAAALCESIYSDATASPLAVLLMTMVLAIAFGQLRGRGGENAP